MFSLRRSSAVEKSALKQLNKVLSVIFMRGTFVVVKSARKVRKITSAAVSIFPMSLMTKLTLAMARG